MAGRAGSPNTTCSLASPSRSFGRFAYFVTRIATNRVERGLPLALRRCGYDTHIALSRLWRRSWGARSFQVTTGVERFLDAKDLGAKDVEPDSFFYDKALQLMGKQPPNKPLFTFIYLGANHFPGRRASAPTCCRTGARRATMSRPSTNICAGRR